jgi:DNA-binding NarL/FixJ family response regulator
MIRVAIVEDDPIMSARLAGAVASAEDMEVAGAATTVAGGSSLVEAGGFDVLLCDLGLPDGSGVSVIRQEADMDRGTDILVITVFADQSKVLDTIRAGARGYLLKDEELDDCIEAIREIRRGGSPISPIIARQLLNQIGPSDASPQRMSASPLSEREHEVLNLLARGFSYSECAEILHVSVNTIGAHVKNIYRKLEVNSRAEALFEASCQGILDRT